MPANAGFYGEVVLSFLCSYVLAEFRNRNRKQHRRTSVAKGSSPVTSSTLLALNRISERSDHKNVRDSKDAKDFSKEIPGEAPGEEQPPAEGPPPALPFPPPFVFIPKVTPTSF